MSAAVQLGIMNQNIGPSIYLGLGLDIIFQDLIFVQATDPTDSCAPWSTRNVTWLLFAPP